MSKLIVYSRENFLKLFQPSEIAAIQAAAPQDAVVAQIWAQFVSRERIRASSQILAAAMDALIAKGLVSADRKAAVCKP